jgi:hypothetical protein
MTVGAPVNFGRGGFDAPQSHAMISLTMQTRIVIAPRIITTRHLG